MRKYGRTDANQAEIVGLLSAIPGVSVVSSADLGNGFPDLVVGYRRKNFLFELKDPDKPPSRRKLTPAQEQFHRTWCGEVVVVETLGHIMQAIGANHVADQ